MEGGLRPDLPVKIFLSYSRDCFNDGYCAPRYVEYQVENIIIHQEFSFKSVSELNPQPAKANQHIVTAGGPQV